MTITGRVIRLNRAQISKREHFYYCLDVTAKSAHPRGKIFAPTWEMVLTHKQEKLSDHDYTIEYLERLNQLTQHDIIDFYDWLCEHGNSTLMFLCYCADEKFCHTHLLIDWLCQEHPLLFCDGRK